MKKLLFIFALFVSLVTAAQDIPPGYTNLNNRYQWTAGLFRALGVPAGDSAQFQTGQAQRQGALYYDSTDNNTPKGLYQWNGSIWQIVGTPGTSVLPDDVVSGRSVTWEGGFRFHVQEGIVRIDNQLYLLDSFTHTLDSNDATYDRFDRIYDDITGSHVLEGVAADPAAIPQLQGGQIGLTTILLENGGTNPSVSSLIVYQENDATITPSGTTAVGNSTANPFVGTYNIRITTINNGDYVDIIKSSGTWDISDVTSLTLHIRNRAQVPQLANLRVSLWNGSSNGSQVSGEVILNYNKNNTTTYMAVAIPMAAFGTITNTNIDRIRLRFTSNNNNNFTGYDLDNIEFQAGVPQPGNGSTGQFTLTLPSFLTITPSSTIITNNTNYTIAANGSSSQYVRGDGSLATFSAVTTVGSFGSQASNSNGAVISGSSIYFQPVTASNPGMVTSAMKASWDSIYTAENLSSVGDSIMTQVAVDRLGFKSIVAGSNITLTDTDSTIIIAAGAGGSARFGYAGEDEQTSGEDRTFTVNDPGAFNIEFVGGSSTQYIRKQDNQNLRIGTESGGDGAFINFGSGIGLDFYSYIGFYTFDNLTEPPGSTNKMVVWDSTSNQVYVTAIPSGGAGTNIYNTDGALTDSRTVDLDGNSLVFADGVTPFLTLDPGANEVKLQATDIILTGDATVSGTFSATGNTAFGVGPQSEKLYVLGNTRLDGNAQIDDVVTFLGSTSGSATIFSGSTGITLESTNATGTGAVETVMFSRATSDVTLSNINTVQAVFGSSGDVWTLQGNTTYWIEGFYSFTHGASSHSVGMSFELGGGASITSISYTTNTWVTALGTPTATQNTNAIQVATNTNVNSAGANATEQIWFSGFISMNAGGTVTPSITFSAAPGGSPVTEQGSYIKFTPVANGTATVLGAVN